jgi:parvulin-like peptidyl-prolyl isomerase
MKVICPFLALFLGVAALYGQTYMQPRQQSIPIDGYAARVNDRVITHGDVLKELAPRLPDLYRNYQGAAREEAFEKAYAEAREQLVERALIVETFEARETPIPDQYIEDEIRRIISDRFEGDETLFEQMLTGQKMTHEEYKDTLREYLAVQLMTNEEVYRRARVTPEQVREAYEADKESYFIPEQVRHSVIVLNRGASPSDRAVKLEEARSIRERLMNGADFNETARAASEGSRAAEGGAFTWMRPEEVRPALRETLRTLPAGEISDIVETENELYIVKVEARRQAGYRSFDEVRQTIKDALKEKEIERLKTRWISRLKENNYVVIYD